MISTLLALASSVVVQPLATDHYRLTIYFSSTGVSDQAEAQFALADAAKRLCKGKGQATSEGALELNEVPKTDVVNRKKGRLSLTEEWRCVSPTP